jgi:hypothetical protein
MPGDAGEMVLRWYAHVIVATNFAEQWNPPLLLCMTGSSKPLDSTPRDDMREPPNRINKLC